MADAHPLDRPVWNALTGRQQHLASGDDLARRLDPGMGYFAAAADDSSAALHALAALAPETGVLWLVETAPVPPPPGLVCIETVPVLQMLADAIAAPGLSVTPLGDADASEMHALAALTQPGPFLECTHRFGGFLGRREAGALAAMAGQRLQPPGHVEVSGVCSHPAWRGSGFGAALTQAVAAAVLARGERPFLHVYPGNVPAVRLYERLGFRVRREMVLTILARR
jgi:ribosomal protein S18 acetylase RimI-like enzyme